MKALQNDLTTIEQSRRLLELGLPMNSANHYYGKDGKIHHIDGSIPNSLLWTVGCIPCWSVGRLIEIYVIARGLDTAYLPIERGEDMVKYLIRLYEDKARDLDFSKLED